MYNSKLSTKEIGRLGEVEFERFCFSNGIPVSKACVEAYPYDYIIDVNNKLYKVQVKTTERYDGKKYHFSTRKTSLVHSKWKTTKYTSNDVDLYFLYCITTNKSFLMKFLDVGDIVLRDEKCRQNVNVHYAGDYEAQKVLEEIKNQKC